VELSRKLAAATRYIRGKTSTVLETGIILGSGLSGVVSALNTSFSFSFDEIPFFPKSTVEGHAGKLVIGDLSGARCAVLAGRIHFYENLSMNEVLYPVRLLRSLGVKNIILTSAVGALNLKYNSGDLVLLKDHINLMGASPLAGTRLKDSGEMFPDMSEVYDPGIADLVIRSARKADIHLRSGVYCAVCGPQYETPAEVRAFRKLGGDIVGMSVVPEAVCARQMGMRVAGISYVSNVLGGRRETALSHKEVLEAGKKAAAKYIRIFQHVLKGI